MTEPADPQPRPEPDDTLYDGDDDPDATDATEDDRVVPDSHLPEDDK